MIRRLRSADSRSVLAAPPLLRPAGAFRPPVCQLARLWRSGAPDRPRIASRSGSGPPVRPTEPGRSMAWPVQSRMRRTPIGYARPGLWRVRLFRVRYFNGLSGDACCNSGVWWIAWAAAPSLNGAAGPCHSHGGYPRPTKWKCAGDPLVPVSATGGRPPAVRLSPESALWRMRLRGLVPGSPLRCVRDDNRGWSRAVPNSRSSPRT